MEHARELMAIEDGNALKERALRESQHAAAHERVTARYAEQFFQASLDKHTLGVKEMIKDEFDVFQERFKQLDAKLQAGLTKEEHRRSVQQLIAQVDQLNR